MDPHDARVARAHAPHRLLERGVPARGAAQPAAARLPQRLRLQLRRQHGRHARAVDRERHPAAGAPVGDRVRGDAVRGGREDRREHLPVRLAAGRRGAGGRGPRATGPGAAGRGHRGRVRRRRGRHGADPRDEAGHRVGVHRQPAPGVLGGGPPRRARPEAGLGRRRGARLLLRRRPARAGLGPAGGLRVAVPARHQLLDRPPAPAAAAGPVHGARARGAAPARASAGAARPDEVAGRLAGHPGRPGRLRAGAGPAPAVRGGARDPGPGPSRRQPRRDPARARERSRRRCRSASSATGCGPACAGGPRPRGRRCGSATTSPPRACWSPTTGCSRSTPPGRGAGTTRVQVWHAAGAFKAFGFSVVDRATRRRRRDAPPAHDRELRPRAGVRGRGGRAPSRRRSGCRPSGSRRRSASRARTCSSTPTRAPAPRPRSGRATASTPGAGSLLYAPTFRGAGPRDARDPGLLDVAAAPRDAGRRMDAAAPAAPAGRDRGDPAAGHGRVRRRRLRAGRT